MTTVESGVYERYAAAASQVEAALCCPVQYDPQYMQMIPAEIIERDYGCGDPSAYIKAGETVLDLGSGGGKLCYIAAQVVGASGRVIGVDCNLDMLGLARKYQAEMATKMGYRNIDFRYGMIQDLQLDLQRLENALAAEPVKDASGYLRMRNLQEQLRSEHPLVADDSIDCVISNCVLNLVRSEDRHQLFAEIFRVLKRGGRAVISDIVSDETVPKHLQDDSTLWSGCISGAFREDEFLRAFEDAGFHGVLLEKRARQPWQTVEGIEFRSVTVIAYKGKQGPCMEHNHALIYRGPFRKVHDDDGHTFLRGQRFAVCDKTFQLLTRAPYAEQFEAIEPRVAISADDAEVFNCQGNKIRDPKQTKGHDQKSISASEECCGTQDGPPCC